MQVAIDTSQKTQINWTSKGVFRIVQNVINLLNTCRYEVAYDRTLGLSGEFLDMPLEQAIAQATTEIYELIAEREPRARVEDITLISVDASGDIQLRVVIDVG